MKATIQQQQQPCSSSQKQQMKKRDRRDPNGRELRSYPPRKQPPQATYCQWIVELILRCAFYLFLSIFATMLLSIAMHYTAGMEPPGFMPSPSMDANNTNYWKNPTGRGGLELTIENALSGEWLDPFDEYIMLWENGYDNVDPLTISVERVDLDPTCRPTAGKLKVCNADYGDTGWRGINIALTDKSNVIRHSVSKFNDFYAGSYNGHELRVVKYTDYWGQTTSEAQTKYTMCHELGHGFGLPHTDENMFNLNTGECMDYTKFPRRNLSPGKHNFDVLNRLYGTKRKAERSLLRAPLLQAPRELEFSEALLMEYEAAVEKVSADKSCFDCHIDIGDGYRVKVHKLPESFGG